MEAVHFITEYHRMCNTCHDCIGCPIFALMQEHHIERCDEEMMFKYPKTFVSAVDKWRKEHPEECGDAEFIEQE